MTAQPPLLPDMPEKRAAKKKLKPEQLTMFKGSELFAPAKGHIAPDWRGTLELQSEDPRTPDQVEQDRMKDANRRTPTMFSNKKDGA